MDLHSCKSLLEHQDEVRLRLLGDHPSITSLWRLAWRNDIVHLLPAGRYPCRDTCDWRRRTAGWDKSILEIKFCVQMLNVSLHPGPRSRVREADVAVTPLSLTTSRPHWID